VLVVKYIDYRQRSELQASQRAKKIELRRPLMMIAALVTSDVRKARFPADMTSTIGYLKTTVPSVY
jgi:hypothetical protein